MSEKEEKNKEIHICEIKSMHGLTVKFNIEETIKNIVQICGLKLEGI